VQAERPQEFGILTDQQRETAARSLSASEAWKGFVPENQVVPQEQFCNKENACRNSAVNSGLTFSTHALMLHPLKSGGCR
jgi:hypothetical protein